MYMLYLTTCCYVSSYVSPKCRYYTCLYVCSQLFLFICCHLCCVKVTGVCQYHILVFNTGV